MIIIKRNKITFYIEENSIVVSNADFQYTSFNTYSSSNKAQFFKFRSEILESDPDDFTSIVDVVLLSGKYQVWGSSAKKPNLDDVEYEYRP